MKPLSSDTKNKLNKVLLGIILFSFLGSAIFVVVKLIISPNISSDLGVRSKSDYILMLLQCLLGIVAMLIPSFISKTIKITIPSKMILCYALFLYCAIYLGEVRSFYYAVPFWDMILHAFSGMMLGALGYSLLSILNNSKRVPVNLSPAFVLIFTVCFAVTVGVLWEVYEFLMDFIFKTNMQKFATYNGTVLSGNAALQDTMKDLIVDFVGAFLVAIVGFISQKTKKNYLKDFELKAEN